MQSTPLITHPLPLLPRAELCLSRPWFSLRTRPCLLSKQSRVWWIPTPGSAAVQSEAVGALHCLAGHANNEVRIAAAGAIPLLVALLGAHNTAVVQVKAAWVLRSLVCSTDNKVKIAASLPWWPCWALRSLQRCRRRQQRLCKTFVFAMMTTAENANFESPDCQD